MLLFFKRASGGLATDQISNNHVLIFPFTAEGLLPSNLLAPVIGGAIGGLILLIFVIAVIVVVAVTLVRRSRNSNNLRPMQSKDRDISMYINF